MRHEVIIPKTGLYVDDAYLLEWLIDEGQFVNAGQPLFRMETEKVEQEIEAETAGFLHRTAEVGADYPIASVIGVLSATREEHESLVGESTG